MGIAVPSLVEASSRLPSSVKADPASADDVLVTSVASVPPAVDEPVSPELALVDPDLRERLRALLPVIELEPPPPLLRAVPDPHSDEALPLVTPDRVGSSDLEAVVHPAPQQVPVYVYPTRGERFRSFAKAFVLGAAAATVITVGVIAERDEGPVVAQEAGTAPPTVGVPVRTPKIAPAASGTQKTAKKSTSAQAPGTRSKKTTGKQGNTKAASRAKTQPASAKGSAKAKTAGQARRSKATAPRATAEPKRFAWAPVNGAVGYRFELFRGDKQVLDVRTKTPAYELAGKWQHAGRTETLTKGDYRWYVWPVRASGPAPVAVVQARLTVP